MKAHYQRALIVGAGDGLSASLARVFAAQGWRIGLAARNTEKLQRLSHETQAFAHACDVSQPAEVDALFNAACAEWGEPADVVVFNPSARVRGAFTELDQDKVAQALAVTAYGGFLVAQAAVKRMLAHRHGALLFTGASASIKGYAKSAPFAMGKFALRGLAQSLARELHPQGIHIGHIVIDGAIRNPGAKVPADSPDSMLDPDAIAQTYLDLLNQDRSAWSWEIEIRPWVEQF